ncbi:hypothetical protein J6590_043754 [Homalodisca vitripennis]|nr:hypothetical protein J6590_043754 [Homalodisca vitripennis]
MALQKPRDKNISTPTRYRDQHFLGQGSWDNILLIHKRSKPDIVRDDSFVKRKEISRKMEHYEVLWSIFVNREWLWSQKSQWHPFVPVLSEQGVWSSRTSFWPTYRPLSDTVSRVQHDIQSVMTTQPQCVGAVQDYTIWLPPQRVRL